MGTPIKWARNAILSNVYNRSTFVLQSIQDINHVSIRRPSKHTFFPGNEHMKSRLIIKSKYVLDGDSLFKLFWDISIMVVTIYASYAIPYSLSFFMSLSDDFFIFIGVFYMADVLLAFNTSYYSRGILVSDRSKIAKNYLETWFFGDLLASFPFELFFLDEIHYTESFPVYTYINKPNSIRFLMLLKLIRLLKYKKVAFTIRQLVSYNLVHILTTFFSYLYGVSLILHLVSCLYNTLYVNSLFETDLNYETITTDSSTRYLKFMMRSMETITSVGYGEFPPMTILERTFSIFIMTLTSGLFGFYIGAVESFIAQTNQIDYYFNDIVRKTKIYMRKHNCPPMLRSRTINFIRNLKKMHSENLLKEQDILSLLSGPMKAEVFSNIQGHYLLRIHEFKSISSVALRAFSYKMKLQMFGPGDRIITQGEVTDDLYFVVGGHVEVFHNSTNTIFRVLGHHSYFGEISFFCGTARAASVRSFDYCELLSFKQKDFLIIVNSIPRDKETIEVFLRNISHYGIGIMGVRCYLCEKTGHCAVDCSKFKIQIEKKIVEKSRKIPRPKFDVSRQYEALKHYSLRQTVGVKTQIMFGEGFYLQKAANEYSEWFRSTDKKMSGFFSVVNVMQKIEEEDESASLDSKEEMMSYSWTKTEKIKTFMSEKAPDLKEEDSLKRSQPIHFDALLNK